MKKIIFVILCIILSTLINTQAKEYAPGILKTNPVNGAENVAINTQISIEFSHQMNKKTLNKSTVTLYNEFGQEIPTTHTWDDLGFKLYIKPIEELSMETNYSIILTSYKIKDVNGMNLRQDYSLNFRTEKIAQLRGNQKDAPRIISLFPGKSQENIPLDSRIILGFNKDIKPSTINMYTLIIENMRGNRVSGTYKYSHKLKKVVFVPSDKLENNMLYRIRVTEGITDTFGNYIINPMTWTFKTSPPPDKTPPFVRSTSPEDKAVKVSINSDISVNFNEKINPVTVNTVNFKLFNDEKEVPVTLSYSPIVNKVIISPEGGLLFDAEYRVRIAKSVKDMSGNFMLYDYTFSFKMEKQGDIIPPNITSTVPLNKSEGVKIDSKIKLYLSERIDNTTVNEKNIRFYKMDKDKEIVGILLLYNEKNKDITIIPESKLDYLSDYQIEISDIKDIEGNSIPETFVLNFTTIEAPDTESPFVKNIKPLKKDFNVAIDTLVEIEFSEPVNSSTITNDTIRVIDEATGHQAFMSFNTQAKLITKLVCKPVIKLNYLSRYIVRIGPNISDKAGNRMDEEYSSHFTTEKNPDIYPPQVLKVSPAPNSENISINSTVSVYFSESLRQASINSYSIFLYESNNMIDCDITWFEDNNLIIMKPQSLLNYDTTYKILISNNIKDLAGNAFSEKSYYFKTTPPPDTVSPYVMITSPLEGSSDVSVDSIITAKFSEKIDKDTIQKNFTLLADKKTIKCDISYNELTQKAMLEPQEKLRFSQTYTAVISEDVKDLAGNSMKQKKVWNFKVEDSPDLVAPTVLFYEPAAGRKDVSINTKIKVKFSEAMKESTINEYSILFSSSDREKIDGIVNYIPEENTLEFYPNRKLDYEKTYFFLLNTVVCDVAGNNMVAPLKFHFRTEQAPDTTRPQIVDFFPQRDRTNIPVDSKLKITFSENINIKSFNKFTVFLKNVVNDKIEDIEIEYNPETFTATINSLHPMEYFSDHTLTVSRIVRDNAGNNLKSTFITKFRTEPRPDNVPPQIVSSFPEDNNINIDIRSSFYVQFSEDMYEDSLNINNIYLKDEDERKIECELEYNKAMKRLNIIPIYSLKYEKYYSIILNNITDIAGNTMRQGEAIAFKTQNLPDMEAPRIIKYSPKDLERNVDVKTKIFVYFTEPLDKETLTQKNILLEKYNTQLDTKIFYDINESRLEIVPTEPLEYKTEYKVLISSAIKDPSGNLLDRTYIWRFYTQAPPDRLKPQLVSVTPDEDSTDNPYTTKITAQFSEKIHPESVNKYTFFVRNEKGETIDFKIVTNGDQDRAVIIPEKELEDGKYAVHITSGIQDFAGNVLANPKTYYFTAGKVTRKKSPVIVLTNPENNSINVSRYEDISVTFNVPIDKTTINGYTFVVSDGVTKIEGEYEYNNYMYKATFHPLDILEPDTVYNVTLTTGIKSLDGVNLDKRKVIMFRTADN